MEALHGNNYENRPRSRRGNGLGEAEAEKFSEWFPTSYLEPYSNPELPYALLILNQPIHGRWFERYWRGATFTICADGGANRLYEFCQKNRKIDSSGQVDHIPTVIHGDLDSLLPSVKEFYKSHGSNIIPDTDQETTDFMKCLKYISSSAGIMARPTERLNVVAVGSLGGRVDQGLSQLHHLYMASRDSSLNIREIVFMSEDSITFLLHKGYNKIHTPLNKGFLAENVGIIPLGRPAVISTKGLEWDVTDWRTEFGDRISTSNHIKSDIVEVISTERVVFTVELAQE